MSGECNDVKDIMLNGIVAVRHILRDADHRLKGIEDGLSLLNRQLLSDPQIRLITVRHEQTDEGALGTLLFDRRLFCITLEPDAGDPARHQTPAGVYPVKPFSGTKFKNTLEVIVPDHTEVLFHNGSFERHTTMCVLVGYQPIYLWEGGRSLRAIIDSRKAYKRFQAKIVPLIQPGDKAAFVNFYL